MTYIVLVALMSFLIGAIVSWYLHTKSDLNRLRQFTEETTIVAVLTAWYLYKKASRLLAKSER